MRRLTFILAPLVIIVAAAALRIADPPLIEALRLATFDEYQRLAPRAYVDAGVRVVDIDDRTLEKFGQWPWPRTQLAALLARLAEFAPAAVAFNAVFAEPDRTSPGNLLPQWAEAAHNPALRDLIQLIPDHDSRFAAAIGRVPTVLGIALTHDGVVRTPARKWGIATAGDRPAEFLPTYSGAVTNLPILEATAAGIGSFNVAADRGAVIHRVPLLFRLKAAAESTGELYPSLAAEALRVARGASVYNIKASGADGETAFGEHTGINHIRIGRIIVPTTARGELWLYDTGPVRERVVPAWEIFESKFDRSRLVGSLVFIGTSAAGLKDLRATPLDPAAAGVEVHAQIAEQIVLGEYLERPDWLTGAELSWLVVFGVAMALLLARAGAAWGAGLAVLGTGLAFGASWLAFRRLGWLIDPVYPSLAALALYLGQSLLLHIDAERELRRLRRQMAPEKYRQPRGML
ncbi:MAG: CHASE2 domain-containing protein [Proteobacteria bacterium]|nr:CHASE2 domain-containing protein [Pseudomonadota bacterium]